MPLKINHLPDLAATTPAELALLDKMFFFSAQHLAVDQTYDCTIDVLFEGMDEGVRGTTAPPNLMRSSRTHELNSHYMIELNPIDQTFAEVLDCLGHEMVHVAQMLTGRLITQKKPPAKIFEGKTYTLPMLVELDRAGSRHDVPWEKEAYAKQSEIWGAFVATLTPDELKSILCIGRVKANEAKMLAEMTERLTGPTVRKMVDSIGIKKMKELTDKIGKKSPKMRKISDAVDAMLDSVTTESKERTEKA